MQSPKKKQKQPQVQTHRLNRTHKKLDFQLKNEQQSSNTLKHTLATQAT